MFTANVEEVKTYFPTKEKQKNGKVKRGVRIFWRVHFASEKSNFCVTVTPKWKKTVDAKGHEVRTRYYCFRDNRDDKSLALHEFCTECDRLLGAAVAGAIKSALGI